MRTLIYANTKVCAALRILDEETATVTLSVND